MGDLRRGAGGIRPAILLGAHANLRLAEAAALRTGDVDFMRGLVSVPTGPPRNIARDDSAPIEAKVLAKITATLDANTHRFAWQRGGVMVADNVLSTHGRKPFSGECRILVAMAGVGGVGA